MLPFDPAVCEFYSKGFQFWAYLIDVWIGIYELACRRSPIDPVPLIATSELSFCLQATLREEQFPSRKAYAAARRKMLVGFVGDLAVIARCHNMPNAFAPHCTPTPTL